jgi:dihydropteroate synthase
MSIDPGIGFGKTHEHNMALLMAGKDLTMEPSTSILWGVSRKSIVGHLTGHQHPEYRLAGTLAIAAVAHRMGIDIVRVHDVLEHRDLFETLNAFSRKA